MPYLLTQMIQNPKDYEEGKTYVYIVRHGDRQTGTTLPKHPGAGLSEKGKKEAKFVAKEFKKVKSEIDLIYTSTMTRAIETAEEIAKIIGKKPKQIHHLSEFNTLLFKGPKRKKEYWKHYLKYRKAIKVFNKILVKNKGKVLVFAIHGNVIRGILGSKLKFTKRKMLLISTDNCSISKCRFNGTKIEKIICLNNPVVGK